MQDLDRALNQRPDLILLGGGNPARVPDVEKRLRQEMESLLADSDRFERAMGVYDGPAGSLSFRRATARLLSDLYGWPLNSENVFLCNGSQSAFHLLFLLFAGRDAGGGLQRILLPQCPEYIGYADAPLDPGLLLQAPPQSRNLDGARFRYQIDFEALQSLALRCGPIGAVLLSRPCNPTGGVCSDQELQRCLQLARQLEAPLVIDQAYGQPFPGLIYGNATPLWAPDIVLCLSLSKAGMPGLRTGIVIANEETVQSLEKLGAMLSLAPGRCGPELAMHLMQSGDLITISKQYVLPYYEERRKRAEAALLGALGNAPGIAVHAAEGAFFLWVRAGNLAIDGSELYRRIAARGVLVTPGRYFYYGQESMPAEAEQTLRLSYAQDPELVARGMKIVAEELIRASV